MIYEEKEARKEIIRAGRLLQEKGLVARTWGNISARVSETHFIVTPSGRAYETLTEDQLVRVNLKDGTFDGKDKPSSEWGVHADTYLLHPESGFVIHTHQPAASAFCTGSRPLEIPEEIKTPERIVPVAGYGLPSTNRLRAQVRKVLGQFPQNRMFLMKNHGALLVGRDMEEAFVLADLLEEAARLKMEELLPEQIRTEWKNRRDHSDQEVSELCGLAAQKCGAAYVGPACEGPALSFSRTGQTLAPWVDDLAQIAGVRIRCCEMEDHAGIIRELKHKNAVFIKNRGVLCTGQTEADVDAVRMIVEKACMAAFCGKALSDAGGDAKPLHPLDAKLQRCIYLFKYSKRKV